MRYRTPQGPREVRALLTVGADGRHSAIREAARLPVREFGSPMDVLWYRLPKADTDPPGSFARLATARLFPMIDRGSYWQGAYTMPKGSYGAPKASGIGSLHTELHRWMPFLGDRIETITGWDDVGFLEVRVNRLKRWHRPGLLASGTPRTPCPRSAGSASTWPCRTRWPRRTGSPGRCGPAGSLRPTSPPSSAGAADDLTQRMQLIMQNNMISPLLEGRAAAELPRAMRMALRLGFVRRLMSRFIANGFRSEHVKPQAATAAA